MPARTHHAAFSCTDRLRASCAPCLLAATNRGPRPSFRAAALALVVLEVLLPPEATGAACCSAAWLLRLRRALWAVLVVFWLLLGRRSTWAAAATAFSAALVQSGA